MTSLPDYITVPPASSLKLSDARRAQLLATYTFVYESFAVDRSDVADAVFSGDKSKASRALGTLRDVGLVASTDVNENAQGSHRRGAFKEIIWQPWATHDDIDLAQALELFARVLPTNPTNPTSTTGANTMTSTNAARTISKTEQKELDRHSALRSAWSEAYAAVETNDDGEKATKLAEDRDKLTKRGYTLRNFDSEPVPPTTEENTVSATADAPVKPSSDYEWPKPAVEVLADYLAERNAPEFDTDNELRPYVNVNGKLFMHSEDWLAWLVANGMPASKSQAAKPLRELGLTVRATPIPTRDYAKGFYTGEVPAFAKDLPRRQPRTRVAGSGTRSNPFAKATDEQRALMITALDRLPKSAVKGHEEAHAQLLALLAPATDATTDAA
jgi:hypothetical protein